MNADMTPNGMLLDVSVSPKEKILKTETNIKFN